ncbi:MAG: dihydrofolate reductase [Pseudomonadota bacterium]
MHIALIWAMTRNGVIGRDNDLPWHLPREMKHFMVTTRGHPVIMGRRTFESMDRPLPRRTNIVVTRQRDYHAAGAVVVATLEEALDAARRQAAADGVDEVFVIGGAELYRRAFDVATRLYVTEIDAELEGDTFFPALDWTPWQRISRERYEADQANPYAFTVSVFERR